MNFTNKLLNLSQQSNYLSSDSSSPSSSSSSPYTSHSILTHSTASSSLSTESSSSHSSSSSSAESVTITGYRDCIELATATVANFALNIVRNQISTESNDLLSSQAITSNDSTLLLYDSSGEEMISNESFIPCLPSVSSSASATSLSSVSPTSYSSMSLPSYALSSTTLLNSEQRDSDETIITSEILLVISLSLMIIVTLIGNILVCLSVILVRKLRKPSNYLLVSLAISDICVAILVMPLALYYEIKKQWTFGSTICDLWVSFDVTSCTASILNICMICIDRYLSIKKPFTYAVQCTTKKMLLLIVAVWITSCLISVPPLFVFRNSYGTDLDPQCGYSKDIIYQLYATLGAFYIPLTVMLILYYKIYVTAKKVVEADLRARITTSSIAATVTTTSASTAVSTTTTTTTTTTMTTIAGGKKHIQMQIKQPLIEKKARNLKNQLTSKKEGKKINAELKRNESKDSNKSWFNLDNDLSNECAKALLNDENRNKNKLNNNKENWSTINDNKNDNDMKEIKCEKNFELSDYDCKELTLNKLAKPLLDESDINSKNNNNNSNSSNNNNSSSNNNQQASASSTPRSSTSSSSNKDRKKLKETLIQLKLTSNIAKEKTRINKSRKSLLDTKHINNNNNDNNSLNSTATATLNINQQQQQPNRQQSFSISHRSSSILKERKAFIVLGIIMTAFTACWLPFFILALLRPLSLIDNIPEWIEKFALWLGFANSMLNPIIYVTFHQDFRQAFRYLLCFQCRTMSLRLREEAYHAQYGV